VSVGYQEFSCAGFFHPSVADQLKFPPLLQGLL
jgi:hypothetical protein